MANNYYYGGFKPQGSIVLAATLVGVLIALFAIGYYSVIVRPRRSGNGTRPEGAPRPKLSKAKKLSRMFRKEARNARYENSATIEFKSATFDVVFATIAGAIIAFVIFQEHYLGIVQFVINNLTSSDSAAWGDIVAICGIVAASSIYAWIAYGVIYLGQLLRATRIAMEFAEKSYVPVFAERYSIPYIAEVLIYSIKAERKNAQTKTEEKAI